MPIQPVSDGKPTRSRMTESWPRFGGRVQGRTCGSRAKGQGWPYDRMLASYRAACSPAQRPRYPGRAEILGELNRSPPSEECRPRPPFGVIEGPQSLTSADRRSVPFGRACMTAGVTRAGRKGSVSFPPPPLSLLLTSRPPKASVEPRGFRYIPARGVVSPGGPDRCHDEVRGWAGFPLESGPTPRCFFSPAFAVSMLQPRTTTPARDLFQRQVVNRRVG